VAIRVAIRPSQLSLRQFDELTGLLPNFQLSSIIIKSLGDADQKTSLLDGSAPEDFFTRELDTAVLQDEADIGLHSAKDLAWPLPKGLSIYALTPRKSPHDELVSRQDWTLENLPEGARIGCSSPARRDQLLEVRPDLQMVSIRGAIHERLLYLDDNRVDAVVVAACALERLGLPAGSILPWEAHPLQGYLAIVGPSDNPKLHEQFRHLDVRKTWGFVSIAGAGPGRKELVTIKTLELLSLADVVLYDALLDHTILSGVPGETVFVGKRQKHHEKTQDEINRLLWDYAMAGKRVVRLKGGDPLVFGRGSEEAEYLGRRLVAYEIVPGVSAAQAAAAYAEIPLTERGTAASISLLRGYPGDSAKITGADMHVVYMPRTAVAELAAQWQSKAPDQQPRAAWITGAASDAQTVVTCNAQDIESQIPKNQEAPLLLIAGSTVDNRAGNGWFDRQRRILYTGSDPVAIPAGVRFTHLPLIRFEDQFWPELDAGQSSPLDPNLGPYADRYKAIIFTSRQTVRSVFARLYERGVDARSFMNLRVVSIGEATTKELRGHGLIPDIQATDDSSTGVVKTFQDLITGGKLSADSNILLPCSDRARLTIREGLRAMGCTVDVVVVYKTLPPLAAPTIDPEFFDEIIFTSPSTVENFFGFFPKVPVRPILRTRGDETARALTRETARLQPGGPV
jgi:uroporphyrinogen III methyltransferase/synthase